MGCKKLHNNFKATNDCHWLNSPPPSGELVGAYGRHHKYMFGGKEQQDELGLNWYDITARNYDPALGRWMNLDPLAAKRIWLSPYNYVQNNPLLRIDPNGLSDYTFDKKTGKFVLIKTTKDKYDRVIKTKKNGKLKKGYKENKRFGHITQGILKNGINFKTKRQLIKVNGKNKDGTSQPTTKQVSKFLVNLAKVAYKEIASFGLVNSEGAEKKLLTLAYKNNESDKAKFPSILINKTINGLTAKNFYHTHFDIGNKVDLSLPSGLNGEEGADIDTRNKYPSINFYIMYSDGINPYPAEVKND